jgi:hypothetical protein
VWSDWSIKVPFTNCRDSPKTIADIRNSASVASRGVRRHVKRVSLGRSGAFANEAICVPSIEISVDFDGKERSENVRARERVVVAAGLGGARFGEPGERGDLTERVDLIGAEM